LYLLAIEAAEDIHAHATFFADAILEAEHFEDERDLGGYGLQQLAIAFRVRLFGLSLAQENDAEQIIAGARYGRYEGSGKIGWNRERVIARLGS
jgi:hypothetical protein